MRFEAIGTTWQIDTTDPIPDDLQRRVHDRIDAFDRTYSRFRDDSLVSAIALTAGTFVFPDDAPPLFDVYRRLYAATDGRMSPLIGGALERLGYDRTYSLRPSGPPAPVPSWDDSFAWDGHALTTVRPVTVDVGAAGKGYLVDIVGGMLRAAGVTRFTVDASGDILHSGQPLRIALEHPLDPSKAVGVVSLGDGSICASASNRRSWGAGLHHLIDATTGLPTQEVIATWAIAATALEADGIATALFFADPRRILEEFVFTYVRMFSTGRVEHSPQLQGEVFT